MISPFTIPDLELELVNKDIRNINSAIHALGKANKDKIFAFEDLDAGIVSYRVMLPSIPLTISRQYSKIMTNLKHILDQSVNAAHFIVTGEESNKIHFPNGSAEVHFNASMKGRYSILDTRIREVIVKYKPFKGGNDELYTLCKFARIKHRPIYLHISPTIANTVINSEFVEDLVMRTKPIGGDGCYELATVKINANNNLEIGYAYKISLLEKGVFFKRTPSNLLCTCLIS